MLIAQRLENELTKGRILELYLNVVELGPLVYGVGHGARYHFDKPVSMLTPAEPPFSSPCSPGHASRTTPSPGPERSASGRPGCSSCSACVASSAKPRSLTRWFSSVDSVGDGSRVLRAQD